MDWGSLLIGLVGGLAGGLLGAAAAVVAVLLQSDAQIDREERVQRRDYRQDIVAHLRRLLASGQQSLASKFQRDLWDTNVEALSARLFDGMGLSDQQIAQLHQQVSRKLTPLPLPADVVREFTGAILTVDDPELQGHLWLLYAVLVGGEDYNVLQPHQVTLLLSKTNLLLERYASVLPEDRISGFARLRRLFFVRGRAVTHVPTLDSLSAQIASVESRADAETH